jgi:hypothetical protein
MSAKRSVIDHALKYAEHGFRVFPVYVFEGDDGRWKKVPPRVIVNGLLCPAHAGLSGAKGSKNDKVVSACRECIGGEHVASSDPSEVRRQFGRVASTAVVGAMPPPGVLILDDDSSVFDPVWWDEPHVRSPSRKRHYSFRLAEGQEPIRSDNLIQYGSTAADLVDVRCAGDTRWIGVPCGQPQYRARNGWHIEPDTYPLLPQNVYDRLLSAPRVAGGAGGGSTYGKYTAGVPAASVGNPYDRNGTAVEELLAEAGWTCDGLDRWTRPGGTDGFGRLNEKGGVWFFNVHTDNDEILRGGHWYTASMLRCVFEHGGNWKQCYLAMFAAGAFEMKEETK